MKTNNEKVLAYLADVMSESEKTEFEKEMQNSDELKMLVEKYSANMDSLKTINDVSLDEMYFANLLPKVRTKLDESKKSKSFNWFVTSIPAAVLSIFVLFNIFYLNTETPQTFQQILNKVVAESDSGTIAQIAKDYSTTFYDDFSEGDEVIDEYLTDIDVESIDQSSDITHPVIDAYAYYDNLSEEEMDHLYNTLINKKIL